MTMRNNDLDTPVTVVIQAGGQSLRMGMDKGLVELRGKPLVRWIIDQTSGIASETLIISNQPADYKPFDFPVYPDIIPGIGALGGLYSAIHYASFDHIFVLACDMPFIHPGLLRFMLAQMQTADVLIPAQDNPAMLEPFRALYRKSCELPIYNAIQAGKRRAISFFPNVEVKLLPASEIEKYDPDGLSFFNINTPEDLAQAELLSGSLPF